MDDNVLQEQLAYYGARAKEYDESIQGIRSTNAAQPEFDEANQEWQNIVNALRVLSPIDEVLELACGTGIWTEELINISRSIVAVDGSTEMIEVNRAKHGTAKIDYQCIDLFQWAPDRQYDLVFFAFWLSHVPPSHLASFLNRVARATKPGGRIFIVDEPKIDSNISGSNEAGLFQHRVLSDGRSFQIIKVYYDPKEIEQELLRQGFKSDSTLIGRSFFSLNLSRAI